MISLNRSSKRIDSVFILLLFVLFTAASILIIVVGSDQYKTLTNNFMTDSNVRNVSSYLREKVHQNNSDDNGQSITVMNFNDNDALCISQTYKGNKYMTYIYCSNGQLMELFVSDKSVVDNNNAGQKIIDLKEMHISEISDGLIKFTFTLSDDSTHDCIISTISSGKESS